jgi:hypothetical protein
MDLFNLPPDFRGDVQMYMGPIATATNSTRQASWKKPRGNLTMVSFIVIGGGAGGAGGFSGTAGTARGGGGGGASAGVARIIVPLFVLPSCLTINVGAGGAGGAAGAAGVDGVNSSVMCAPVGALIVDNTLVRSSNGAPQGGIAGTAAAGGAGGVAGAVGGIASSGASILGLHTNAANMGCVIGQAGGAGGAHTGANGTSIALPATGLILGGGCGGAGTTAADFAGGSVTPAADSWLSEQVSAPPAAGSFDGAGGVQIWDPFFSFGGCGGSSSNAGVGGNGGNGAIGGGGGGGGAGTTGGRGGNGGQGCIIVICW